MHDSKFSHEPLMRSIQKGFEQPNFQEMSQYSLARLANAMASGDFSDATLEINTSNQLAEQMGRKPRGYFVPHFALGMIRQRLARQHVIDRAPPMDSVSNSHLVGTEQLANQFIEALRPNSVLLTAGATPLPGLIQNVSIPKFSGPVPTEHLAEDQDSTDVEAPTTTVSLSPKTIAASVPYTRRLGKQSLPSVDAILLNDVTQGIAQGMDEQGLIGSGIDPFPLGILNQAIQTTPVASPGDMTWSEAVAFETAVDSADAGGLGIKSWIVSPGVRANAKLKEKAAGYPEYVQENDDINSYRVLTTTAMPANTILFGDFTQVLMGFWGILDVLFDNMTKAASGGMVLRLFQDYNTELRHTESFCKNA